MIGAAPLDGIVVADFTRVLAGPLATMTLADLGARVIKVERPGKGDDTRAWGPPYSEHAATYFEGVNRNKESVALDFNDPHDLERAKKLAARADVVIENFLPGTMDRMGLGYEDVARDNPISRLRIDYGVRVGRWCRARRVRLRRAGDRWPHAHHR